MSGAAGGVPTGPIPITEEAAKGFVEVLVANMISLFLSGCAVVQAIQCLRLLFPGGIDPRERSSMRQAKKWRLCAVVVPILLVITVADSAIKITLMALYVKQTLVGGLLSLIKLPMWAVPITTLEGVTACVVQVTWAIRLTMLWSERVGAWPRIIVLGLATASGIAQIAFSTWAGYLAAATTLNKWGTHDQKVSMITWYTLGSISDIILTGSFVAQLARLRTGFHDTDNAVTKWIGHTLRTGLLATIVTIAALIVFIKFPTQGYVIMCTAWLGPTYINSVLYLLRPLLAGRSGSRSNPTSSAGQTSASGYKSSAARSAPALRSHPGSHTASHVIVNHEYTSDAASNVGSNAYYMSPLNGRNQHHLGVDDYSEKKQIGGQDWV